MCCIFRASVGSPEPPRWQAVGWRGGDLPILATYRPQRPSPPTARSPWECCWRLTCLLSPGGGRRSLRHDHTLQVREKPAGLRCGVTWDTSALSLSAGVINLLSVLICGEKVRTAYQIAFEWILNGGKKNPSQETKEEKKRVEMMKQCELQGCEQSWGRLWSEATHFAWLLLLSFWSWASRHEKQQQLGISLPPTHTPTLPA